MLKLTLSQEGCFYPRRPDSEDKGSHAVYGILDKIDPESGSFRIKKIIYVDDKTKMHGLKLHVSVLKYSENDSAIKLRLSHLFDPYAKTLFDKSVLLSWLPAFSLFRKFVES